VCKTRKRNAIHLKVSGPVISLKAPEPVSKGYAMHKAARKRRTREHIIADLSINHVERVVLRSGHTVERFWHDYGFDLLLYTYDNNGEYENGDVRLQVNATDNLNRTTGGTISWRLEWAHLRHWLNEPMPVILIVYHATHDEAF
jgi:hypothetical protein